MRTGQSAKRSLKVCKCCSASKVVGTSTATCRPSIAAMKAARNATSVLPKPTSANEPVHWLAALHIVDHGLNRGALVGRFFKTKARGELRVIARGQRERMPLARRAPRVQVQQFRRGIANL